MGDIKEEAFLTSQELSYTADLLHSRSCPYTGEVAATEILRLQPDLNNKEVAT